jgi:hypothetical protein
VKLRKTKAFIIHLIIVRVKIRLPGTSKGKEGKGCCTDRDAEYFQQLVSRIKISGKNTYELFDKIKELFLT